MPWLHILWTLRAERKLAEHGVTPEEVTQVLEDPDEYGNSRSTGRPIATGTTDAGRLLVVVYEHIDDVTVTIITAYEPDRPG